MSGGGGDGGNGSRPMAAGTTAAWSDNLASSLTGAYASGRALWTGPIDLLEGARREYAKGRLDFVLRDLPAPARKLAEAAEQPDLSPGDRARAARDAASAWTLLARAARRSGQPALAVEAAERGLSLRRSATAGATTADDDSDGEHALALFLAGKLDDAAEAMAKAAPSNAVWPELGVYRGVVEHARGHFEEAARALERATAPDAPDLEQLRLETLAASFEALGAERAGEAVGAYASLAILHFSAGSLPEALLSLDRARALRPDEPPVLAARGEVLRTMGRLEEALAAFDGVLALMPHFPWALARRGATLLDLGRHEDALAALSAALALEPDDAFALASRGETLRLLSRYEEALVDLDSALVRDPENVRVLAGRGDALRLLERYPEAIEALDHALTVDPSYAWAVVSKGIALRQAGRNEEALAAFSRAAEIDPNDEAALTRKSDTLQALGRDNELVAELDKVLVQRPSTLWAVTRKVSALVRLSKPEEAIAACDAALAVDPDNAAILARKGDVLRQIDKYEEALKVLDRALAIDPEDEFTLSRKGETLRLLMRYEESVAVLDQALAKDPTSVYSLTSKADSLRLLGRFAEALATFDLALVHSPAYGWALARKGDALRLLDRHAEALVAFDAALAVDANDKYAISRKGETLRMLSRYEEAITVLDEALRHEPDSVWSLSSKADSLRMLKRFPEAEETIRRAIALEPENLFNLSILEKCLADQGRNQDALEISDQVLALSPRDPGALEAKALALMRLDKVEESLKFIGRRIDVGAEAYALGVRGVTLLAIAEYEKALPDLERSIAIDARLAWVHNHLGHCYMRLALGKPAAESEALLAKAEAASRIAVELEPDDASWRQILGDVLWRRGGARRGEAAKEFEVVLQTAHTTEKLDYYTALSGGWAAYRLSAGRPDQASALLAEAEEFYVEALAAKRSFPASSDVVEVKFDIALAVLCGGRFGLALREYSSALELAGGREPGLQRGLIDRARTDLAEAMADRTQLQSTSHAGKVLNDLDKWYATIPEATNKAEEVLEVVADPASPEEEAVRLMTAPAAEEGKLEAR